MHADYVCGTVSSYFCYLKLFVGSTMAKILSWVETYELNDDCHNKTFYFLETC